MRHRLTALQILCFDRPYVRWTDRAETRVPVARGGRATVNTATQDLNVAITNTVTSTPPVKLTRRINRSGTHFQTYNRYYMYIKSIT